MDWLRRAAEQGDLGGQRNLALCYYEGWGVAQDQTEAAHWYEKAAEQGDPDAQDMLSWMKLLGGGCPQDYPGARAWAEKAAAQGRAGAMARLGDIHHNALGVERDAVLAAYWWERAARLGHAEAQAMLGAAYLAGKGIQLVQVNLVSPFIALLDHLDGLDPGFVEAFLDFHHQFFQLPGQQQSVIVFADLQGNLIGALFLA